MTIIKKYNNIIFPYNTIKMNIILLENFMEYMIFLEKKYSKDHGMVKVIPPSNW